MSDQANAGPKCPTVAILGLHAHQTAAITQLLLKAKIEVTVATKPKMEPLDDGFTASYLDALKAPKFRNDKPYLKRRKGRS